MLPLYDRVPKYRLGEVDIPRQILSLVPDLQLVQLCAGRIATDGYVERAQRTRFRGCMNWYLHVVRRLLTLF